jgi:hypothetical protein
MIRKNKKLPIVFSAALLATAAAYADDDGHINRRNGIQRVLLISIDGMHALDYLNCVSGGYCPNLAKLGKPA